MLMEEEDENKTSTVVYIILLPARLSFTQISSLTTTATQEGVPCFINYPHFAGEEIALWRG